MDQQMEEKEKKYFLDTEVKIQKQMETLQGVIEKGKADVQKQKEFVWENVTDMDEEEVLENKQSLEDEVLLLEFYEKNRKKLERLKESPYFGKIGFTEDVTKDYFSVYIGVTGFRPKEQELPLVYDWRAPISSLYYAYEKGEASYMAPDGKISGVIDEKKQFKIKDGKIQYMLDTDFRVDDEVLRKELKDNTGTKMKQVAATIQKEQNEIIRQAAEDTLVIQGSAGSGKTVIALHRVAWLLYNYRDKLSTQNVMILSPNAFFSDYIAEVLPELGEDNCIEKEWDDLMADMLLIEEPFEYKNDQLHAILQAENTKDERIERIRYKSSVSYFKKINAWLKENLTIVRAMETPLMLYQNFLSDFKKEQPEMEIYQNEQGEICYEDILVIFYLQVRCFGGSFAQIRHLVVDEMQDYNVFQYAVLKKLFTCPKTILGDKNQTLLYENGELLNYILTHVFPEAKTLFLKKSYRSTKEITEFCSKIIKDEETIPFHRSGKEPLVKKERSKKAVLEDISNVLKNRDFKHYTTIAVLCENEEEAFFAYEELIEQFPVTLIKETTTVYCEGILVMPSYVAKGLEFDVAILCSMKKRKESAIARRAFYIAATRALHELYVFHTGSFDAYLSEK